MTTQDATTQSVKQKNQKPLGQATQQYIQFAEAHDDVLVLKDGGLRAVLEVSSINFNLKSEDEQNAIITGYQQFLNALKFPVQILIRSRKLDIDSYMERLQIQKEKIISPLLKEQMTEYTNYIQSLVLNSNIMSKKFYIVVPHNPPRAEKKGTFGSFLQYISPKDSVQDILLRKKEFKNLKNQLNININVVKTALESCGLNVTQLHTKALIDLFYQSYNPSTVRSHKISSLEDIVIEATPSEKVSEYGIA